MKKNYSRWSSIVLIAFIYLLAAVAGVELFVSLTHKPQPLVDNPIIALFCADILATIIVWGCGLIFENVSVYDPYWSVFPPIAFLLFACYTQIWSMPVILLLIASWYWGWRLTRNWVITFKGIAFEDWRYTKYRVRGKFIFHVINFFGLNMVPTLVVFAAMLPGLMLFEAYASANWLTWFGFIVCIASATIQLIADKQIHSFRATHPGQCCNVGLWKHGRHPNYFGEIQFWWGVWIIYASVYGISWLICGPIAMTALFLGISIPLMEQRQLAYKPGYAEYRQHTRLLI
jgi:steroid 5-alpha reductase family enzyme